MTLMRTVLPVIALTGSAVAAGGGDASSCPNDIPLSCHNSTAVENTCCFIPSGQLLQTQFWDTEPATGPSGKSCLFNTKGNNRHKWQFSVLTIF